MKFIEGPGLDKARRKLKSLKNRMFFCEKDARDAFRQTLSSLDADCYTADPTIYEDREAEKRYGDGKLFRITSDNVRVDGSKVQDAVWNHGIQILITNHPFSDEPSENKRIKASADDVIDLYLEQYKAEAGFKMMKSAMDIAHVYIHTPSRITAMAFVVSLATMICETIEHVLERTRESGDCRRTVKSLADIHANTIVKYDRCHDRLSIMGGSGATGDVFSILDRLEIDPQLLLGY